MRVTCAGGVAGADPTWWCEKGSPDGPDFDATGFPAGCLITWSHSKGDWKIFIKAKPPCDVTVYACPPANYPFRKKMDSCGLGVIRFK